MITIVSGKLGSGKSYDTVRMIALHLANGGAVRTNIDLDYRKIGEAMHRRLSPGQIGTLSADDDPKSIPIGDRRGSGKRRVMVVLDEALNWFPSLTSSSSDPRKQTWGEWLRQSDKLGQDVYFIAQNFERSAKWIRELSQVCREIIALKDVSIYGLLPLRYLFPPLRHFYLVRPVDVRLKMRLTCELHYYSPKYWNLYDTSQTFGFSAASSAFDSFVLPPAYHPPFFFLFPCLLLVLVCFVAVTFFPI